MMPISLSPSAAASTAGKLAHLQPYSHCQFLHRPRPVSPCLRFSFCPAKLSIKAMAESENLSPVSPGESFPPSFTVSLSRKSILRYGENPHQKAALYIDNSLSLANAGGIASSIQHHGKEMSYNNYLDADAAWNCVSEFQSPTCVIVKHTNPCGIASRNDILEAYRLAVKGDSDSAYGGIVAFNTKLDEDLAREIREFRSPIDGETRMFYEIVIAPSYTKKGLEVLWGKSETLRILEAKKTEKGMLSLRQVSGGWLAQDSDDLVPQDIKFVVKSERVPEEDELQDAQFAWLCVKHVKSNAIVIAKNNCMLGMGSGQPNRLESLRIACRKAGEEAKGAALASDAFFPFAWKDAVEEACKNGIKVIVEPGGSIRDQDVIDCCNKYGVSLLFTNVRHFMH
ncbi:hypothetical protein J5N97_009073 [Dioscorea zingiberensis]|uniref:Phosphoribosylaminoimidazolecarboxamide formyltransferase n=1 Tax=Dioscorea zingiberensis TaxID=325984 RepID=A0A9D5CWW5_9LILI|nr:hypothetical protein J5N97_009073 [Dioscorea zingiberensis]